MRVRLFIFSLIIIGLSSCKLINRDRMLQTGDDYPYAQFSEKIDREYKISPNDIITFQLFANDGFQLINIGGGSSSSGAGQSQGNQGQQANGGGGTYTVEYDGFIKLPVVGRTYVKGLTIRQMEMMLEELFAEYYHKPFVMLKVNNRRVMVFAGGNSKVVTLMNDNTTLFEVLATIGGMPENGKADQIKIIRGDLKNPEVYMINLSTLEGIKNYDLVMQGNDIIYIETRKDAVTKTIALLGPYLSLISTAILIYGLATQFGK
jgi:polysaccharide biosynthesis/export protein